jgi:hypothetical protein
LRRSSLSSDVPTLAGEIFSSVQLLVLFLSYSVFVAHVELSAL